jgi:putative membrane protein
MTLPDDRPRARPRAFRLDLAEPTSAPADVALPRTALAVIEPQDDPYAREAARAALPPDEAAIEEAQALGMERRGRRGWGTLLVSALGALVSLSLWLWVDHLIGDLFSRTPALGWFGVGLLALTAIAALGLLVKESIGVMRQAKVARLHAALAEARLADDRDAARRLVAEVAALYAARPETARARAELRQASGEIVDGRDLIDIAESTLLRPIDRAVAADIAAAAKRVSLVTAISPRAVLDLLFVAGQIVWLIRRIAERYSGRPGLFGFLKLARSVGAHLAVTGGMAVGDSLVQQVVGHGIAAKLSARLGEGVLNGMLTTRVGLSAMAVCRPMPFASEKPPGVKDVAPFLFKSEG